MAHFRLAALEGSAVPIRSATIEIGTVASGMKCDPKRKGVAMFSGYHREIVTPCRTICGNRVPVLADERRFVFRDTELDGSEPEKGNGPSLLVIGENSGVRATASAGGDFYAKIAFDLGNLSQPFDFALWAPRERTSNIEFNEKMPKSP